MTVPTSAAPTEALPGLAGHEGLDEVEALMVHLAVGARFDRLGRMVQEHLANGGRRTRARLALAAAEALGMARARAVGWAAACELVHNAALVHDDVQDGDRMRRGRPSLWAAHGHAQAINAGDLLLMLPYLALDALDADEATCWRLARIVATHSERTVRGQALEMALLGSRRLDWTSWASAAEGKSGALLALPIEGAALLAGLRPETAAPLGSAFARLGVLYQLYDDALDLWGDKGRERRGNDLREGKVSAVVALYLTARPDDVGQLVALLEKPRETTTSDEVDGMIARFEQAGVPELLRGRIRTLEGEILEHATLRSVPDLCAVAGQLVEQLRSGGPPLLRAR